MEDRTRASEELQAELARELGYRVTLNDPIIALAYAVRKLQEDQHAALLVALDRIKDLGLQIASEHNAQFERQVAEILDTMLGSLKAERRTSGSEMRRIAKHARDSLSVAIEDAGEPLGRSLRSVIDPRTIAERISADVYDYLQEAQSKAVAAARRAFIVTGAIVITASFVVLFFANHRLAAARVLVDRAECNAAADVNQPRRYVHRTKQ